MKTLSCVALICFSSCAAMHAVTGDEMFAPAPAAQPKSKGPVVPENEPTDDVATPVAQTAPSSPAQSAEADYDAKLNAFKQRLTDEARADFPKKCGGTHVTGVGQDQMKLVLADAVHSKKLFKKYDEKDLEGTFDVYCNGTITFSASR